MVYLACDLGAESGRLMMGSVEPSRIRVEELHRFPNTPVRQNGTLRWNMPELWESVKNGLKKAAGLNLPIQSISTDSWGLDYVLFNDSGAAILPVFHYRDVRCERGVRKVREVLSVETVFGETGIQFMPFNTVYQLAAEQPSRLAKANHMLLIADAFNFFLCGRAKAEESLASTSQLYNPRTRNWSDKLRDALGLRGNFLPEIVPSGTALDRVKDETAAETRLKDTVVIAGCSHDTAAAVVAVPAATDNWAYISSGTWSLMGVETDSANLSPECQQLNFTNEVGFGGTIRLLKNIVGLWLVQECRRTWAARAQKWDYATLTQMAEAAEPFRSLIQPADPRFVAPANMPEAISQFCGETSQPAPETPGQAVRCALESLALTYRKTMSGLEKLIGRRIDAAHIVGGGSQNALLNQMSASALGIPVFAGPSEATATGNIIVQAMVAGEVSSLAEGRAMVRKSAAIRRYEPQNSAQWDKAFERFEALNYSQ